MTDYIDLAPIMRAIMMRDGASDIKIRTTETCTALQWWCQGCTPDDCSGCLMYVPNDQEGRLKLLEEVRPKRRFQFFLDSELTAIWNALSEDEHRNMMTQMDLRGEILAEANERGPERSARIVDK